MLEYIPAPFKFHEQLNATSKHEGLYVYARSGINESASYMHFREVSSP